MKSSQQPRQAFLRFRTLLIALSLALGGIVGVAGPASANAPLLLSGSQWLGGSGVNVCDGSTDPYCGGELHVGGWSSNWWQCVELAQRLYQARGWHSGPFAGVGIASDIYDQASSLGMSRKANGNITSIVPGDMIIHGTNEPYSRRAGHVSIVDHVTGTTVYAVSQNTYNDQPVGTYTLSGGTLTKSGSGTLRGIVHDPNNNGNGSGETLWKLRNSKSAGAADVSFYYGPDTAKPVTGDWDGVGTTTIGVVRNDGSGQLLWKLSNNNGTPFASFYYGASTDVAVVGDWDGNGTVTIGIARRDPVSDQLIWKLRNSNSAGSPDTTFYYGASTAIPVVGDWDANGTTTVSTARQDDGTGQILWQLRDANSAGSPAYQFHYGASTDTPVVGDWDGNGTVTVGIARQ